MTGLILWGSGLSPFCLKLSAMLHRAGLDHRWLPEEGGRLENLRTAALITRAKRNHTVLRHGGADSLDEYPAVPFLIDEHRRVHYDSTALAGWIDEIHRPPSGALMPEDPTIAFLADILDEAFDEFGLYLVHHNRWVLSGGRNDAGDRFAAEFTHLAPRFAAGAISQRLAARQTRRLPYLFSVAPEDLEQDLPEPLRAPTRDGFPQTHTLLDEAWLMYLDGMEHVLTDQPFLLGERFTLADASAYGQIGMNLTDAPAAEVMRKRAPRTFAWLSDIRDRRHVDSAGELWVSDTLVPLLDAVGDTFVPLMQQNERAHEAAVARGEALFNEAAFDEGRSLYDGELSGQPFRHVVKSFQVRTWRDLRDRWHALPAGGRATLTSTFPMFGSAFDVGTDSSEEGT